MEELLSYEFMEEVLPYESYIFRITHTKELLPYEPISHHTEEVLP